MKLPILCAVLALSVPAAVTAQWGPHPDPRIPRKADGTPSHSPAADRTGVTAMSLPLDDRYPADRLLASLHGFVVDDSGSAARGVGVTARPWLNPLPAGLQIADDRDYRFTTTTDASGAFAFDEVVAGLTPDEATFEAGRCLSCGNCFECDGCLGACPEDAVIKLGEGLRYEFDYDRCTGCSACFRQCPVHAIEMVPETI